MAVVGAAVILLVTLLLPLGFDNDLYESMAWTLYAYHGLPYLSSWDHNFPGIVFIHWASIALFGASDFGFRLFDYLVHIAMAAVYYRFLRNWLSPRASLLAVLLFALYYASGQWGLAGQRDTYAAFLLLGAASLFQVMKRKSGANGGRSVCIGILCGAAFLVRPTYVFFAVSFLILLWIESRKPRIVALYLAGCVVPIIAFLLPYVFIPNGLSQVYDTLIRFNLEVYASVSIPVNLWSGGRALIYPFAGVGVIFALRPSRPDHFSRETIMFLLFTACALISPIMMGKYFSYHFEPFLLIAIGLAALGFMRLAEMIPNRTLQNATVILALAIFALLYYPRHLFRYYFEASNTNLSPIEATYERVLSDSLYGLAAQRAVINYVDARSAPRDPIEYVSIFPGMRWRLHRPAATRFTSIVPLIAYQRRIPAFGAEWRREFLGSLETVRPHIIIVSQSNRWWPFVGKTNDNAIASIPGLDSLLAANYVCDTLIGGYMLYHIR